VSRLSWRPQWSLTRCGSRFPGGDIFAPHEQPICSAHPEWEFACPGQLMKLRICEAERLRQIFLANNIRRGSSVRSDGDVLTMLLCSASSISAICSIPTKNITTRLVRTYRCTRTRRSRVPSRLSVARWRCQFWADCTTNISERKFPTGTGGPCRRTSRKKIEGRTLEALACAEQPLLGTKMHSV
jgi:hypothetical protein